MKKGSYNPLIKNLLHLFMQAILVGLCMLPNTSAHAQKDSTTDKFGFKSLFKNKFDASKPYAAQLNPRAVSFVQEYMRKHTKSLEKMKLWGKPYFDLYDVVLAQYGIPKEMKYLSVIESNLGAGVVSWAGAAGPWQIMDFEAKRFGLSVRNPDERMDYNKSTHVAAKIMRELFAQFNDWLLVVAGYNGGAGRVRQAIKKTGSRLFHLILPADTGSTISSYMIAAMRYREITVRKNYSIIHLKCNVCFHFQVKSLLLRVVQGILAGRFR